LSGEFCQISDPSAANRTCAISWSVSNIDPNQPHLFANFSVSALPGASAFSYAVNRIDVQTVSSLNVPFASPTKGPFTLRFIDASSGVVLSSTTVNVVAVITTINTPAAGTVVRGSSTKEIQWIRKPMRSMSQVSIGYSVGTTCQNTSNIVAAAFVPVNADGVTYSYTWQVPSNIASTQSIVICVTDIYFPTYPLASAQLQLTPFSANWTTIAGIWRGTETMAAISPITGQCQIFTCPNVQLHITSTQIQQTYPMNSPCGSGTLIAPLSAASYDSRYVRSDSSGKCSQVILDGNSLYWSYLSGPSSVCPFNYTGAAPLAQIGCTAGQAASSSTFKLDSTPSTRLMGTWTGTVKYAVPQVFGSCSIGTCTSTITFTPTTVTLVWPALCGAGSGTTVSAFDPTLYDGVFYLNAASGSCTRLEVIGDTMVRSQLQAGNTCPASDNNEPSCDSGGVFIWETYQRGSATTATLSFLVTMGTCLLASFLIAL
jgi:hypothetical protein